MAERPPRRVRVDVALVVGGRFHDFDTVRGHLLDLLAVHPHIRTSVHADYESLPLDAAAALVSYTCDVRPSQRAQDRVSEWLTAGHRWLALHGTNAALDLPRPLGVESPRCFPKWAEMLGSQFVAHPPIAPYQVSVVDLPADDPAAWLVEGLSAFETSDELYLSEYHERSALQPLLTTQWSGEATGFAEHDWTNVDPSHLVAYLRPFGRGTVLYNSLGHCRGHYDMAPLVDYYPVIERGSWDTPQFVELLRRSIVWLTKS